MSAIALLISAALAQAKEQEPIREVFVRVHLDSVIGPISPYIYGTNDTRPQAWTSSKRHTLGRLGGNRWTAYNWENNASNAGKDWHHQNDGYLSDSDEPARAVTDRLDVIQKHGAPALVTVPIQGWVAADKLGGGDVNKSGEDYLSKRFFPSVDSAATMRGLLPDKSDRVVYQDEFVAYLENRRKRIGPHAPPIWYSLDNEPDLWHDTHPRIQPTRPRRSEFIERSVQFARAIKAKAPDALVFGPAVSGWMGMTKFHDGDINSYFIDDYLTAFNKARGNGLPLLDVLDVHWYPEHRSGDGNDRGGTRVTSDSSTPGVARQRTEAPRSLNDPTFIETSWITQAVKRGPINLIPSLRRTIDRLGPRMKLAFTEYYYGGGGHPSGAVAQAEVLGIFGKEGVFAANLFHIGKTDDRYILAAFDLFRNYDGKGSAFGDTAVEADSSNHYFVGAYAAVTKSKATILLVNRQEVSTRVELEIRPKPLVIDAKRFHVAAPEANVVRVNDVDLNNLVLPPTSATLIVLPR